MQLSLQGYVFYIEGKNKSSKSSKHNTLITLQRIHESDFYVVFLSEHSIESRLINEEINFALKEKITIISILLDDSEISSELAQLNSIDARFSITTAVEKFMETYKSKNACIC